MNTGFSQKIQDWQTKYYELLKNNPKENDILFGLDNKPIRVNVDLKEGSPPFIYVQAFVPDIVGCDLGWFCQNVEAKQPFGWKIVFTPHARQDILIKLGIKERILAVKSVKVLSVSRTGNCLLGQAEEYLSDDDYEFVRMQLKQMQEEMESGEPQGK